MKRNFRLARIALFALLVLSFFLVVVLSSCGDGVVFESDVYIIERIDGKCYLRHTFLMASSAVSSYEVDLSNVYIHCVYDF